MDSRKVQVVIADDHTIFRDGLRRLLDLEEDLEVVGEAADGSEAVAMVHEHKPSILLLDLAMPRTPGMDALRELAQQQTSTCIILLTAAIGQRQIVEALQIGARGIVMKDAATQLLLKAIRTVVAGQYWVDRKPVADIVGYLREQTLSQNAPRKRGSFGLTRREIEILGTIATGLTNKEIAQKFSLSEDTVKHHLTNIFGKVGVSSRLELALFAINNRLIEN
ncbi:MAG: DNA-binding response regulator [Acidobacteria bacterium]|nr:MAG: DNA-binding response regulator [Acidobacteriota bacterium]